MLQALHSPAVSIREAVIEATTKKPLLIAEVKLIFGLVLLGLGILGTAFLFLNSNRVVVLEGDDSSTISPTDPLISPDLGYLLDVETKYILSVRQKFLELPYKTN